MLFSGLSGDYAIRVGRGGSRAGPRRLEVFRNNSRLLSAPSSSRRPRRGGRAGGEELCKRLLADSPSGPPAAGTAHIHGSNSASVNQRQHALVVDRNAI